MRKLSAMMGSAMLDLLLEWLDGPIELLPLRIT